VSNQPPSVNVKQNKEIKQKLAVFVSHAYGQLVGLVLNLTSPKPRMMELSHSVNGRTDWG